MIGAVQKVLGSSAGLSGAVVFSSVFGVALNIIVPFTLQPEEYARYSLLLGFSHLLTSVVFEWVRVAVIRHGYGGDAELADRRRTAMAWAYVATVVVLLMLSVAAFAVGQMLDWAALVGVVILSATVQGAFDGQQASTRARFDNALFSSRWIVRSFLGFVLSIAAALLFESGMAVLLGLALSYPLAALIHLEDIRPTLRRHKIDWKELVSMLRLGELAAIGTNLSVAVPALIRSVVVGSLGLAGASGVLLAIDLGQRLFSTLGMAINIVTFQTAIRAVEHDSEAEIARRVRSQIVVAAAIIAPMAIGFVALQDPIAALIVPPDYRSGFAAGILAVMVASSLQAIRQYGLDPLFVIFGKSIGAPLAPAMVIGLLFVATLTPVEWWGGPLGAAVIPLMLSSVAGLAVTLVALVILTKTPWPWRDIWCLSLAVGVMGAIALLMPTGEGFGYGVVLFSALSLPYATLVVLLDIGGIREGGGLIIRRLKARGRAA